MYNIYNVPVLKLANWGHDPIVSSLKSRPRIHADILLFWNISVCLSPAYRLSVGFCTRDSNEPRKRVFRTRSCDCMKRPKCILATVSAFCTRIGAGGWFLVSCGVFDFARAIRAYTVRCVYGQPPLSSGRRSISFVRQRMFRKMDDGDFDNVHGMCSTNGSFIRR